MFGYGIDFIFDYHQMSINNGEWIITSLTIDNEQWIIRHLVKKI